MGRGFGVLGGPDVNHVGEQEGLDVDRIFDVLAIYPTKSRGRAPVMNCGDHIITSQRQARAVLRLPAFGIVVVRTELTDSVSRSIEQIEFALVNRPATVRNPRSCVEVERVQWPAGSGPMVRSAA